jgi:hypothetical protein
LILFNLVSLFCQIIGADAVASWYSEVKDYDFNSGGFSGATGHFTQLVWKGTTNVGAGYAFTPDRTKVYVVAQYTPPGNYQDQYGDNVSPAAC